MQSKLSKPTSQLNKEVETALEIMISTGAVPYKRSSSNEHLHRLISAVIAIAHRLKENIEVSSIKVGYYAERKVSTKFINYLYWLVGQDLLISSSPVQLDLFYKFGYAPTNVKASGASSVGDTFSKYLNNNKIDTTI